jgi:2-keto-3-deoxy-L-rhamnonate aldolase RhmA
MGKEELLASFKSRLGQGQALFGMQHNSGSAAVLELIAYSDFDFVILDMEHSTYTMEQIENLVRTAEAAGIVAFVRVSRNDPDIIMRTLETGAQGILVPHVASKADCESAMAAMRYRPAGVRGRMRATRAARWGRTAPVRCAKMISGSRLDVEGSPWKMRGH